ncbi:unnamed protein product, partial [Rotaria sp. Silwood1]
MGEKAVTSEVIDQLLIALMDTDKNVRWNACQAIGKIVEKAGTSEVINQLLIPPRDADENI